MAKLLDYAKAARQFLEDTDWSMEWTDTPVVTFQGQVDVEDVAGLRAYTFPVRREYVSNQSDDCDPVWDYTIGIFLIACVEECDETNGIDAGDFDYLEQFADMVEEVANAFATNLLLDNYAMEIVHTDEATFNDDNLREDGVYSAEIEVTYRGVV